MQKPSQGLALFPFSIPGVAIQTRMFNRQPNDEALSFYVQRISFDGISKKLIVRVSQIDTGDETTLEIPHGKDQQRVRKALELAQLTRTPLLLAVETEEENSSLGLAA